MIGVKVAALLCLALLAAAQHSLAAESESAALNVSTTPMHSGRINPMLFGNFIELLDDLVPGMWAEMLNDRSFEGVTGRANWCYYDGEPNFCDREWQQSNTWTHDSSIPFNGSRCAKLTPKKGEAATLAQSDLAVRKGMTYIFSGYLHTDSTDIQAKVVLKSLLPDGEWMELASARLPKPSGRWEKYIARMTSVGTADRAVFELTVSGSGSLWVDKLSLMPSDNINGWRADVVQAIREARPAIIRWGGAVCDPGGYRWKDGIGDRDRRVPFPNTLWGRIDSNDVGIDEFCQFCKLVGAEPLVCVSFSDGPESAADLVQYCNGAPDTEWGAKRTANGHPEPHSIKYWQLGNELGDANYVKALPDFCKQMTNADSSVVLISSFPSQELLDEVGREIKYVGPHHYTADFAACEADLRNLAEMTDKTPGCGHIKIAVTEWNVTAGSWGLMRGKLLTLETALLNARYLNLLMRHSDAVDIACRSNMTNSLGSGIIGTNPSGLYKRPSYYVMKLYADHAKPIPVIVQNVPPGVDVSACASEDKKSVCVFAVNTNSEPVELLLDLSEFGTSFRPVGGEIVRDTLDARQPDVMNRWTTPDRVRTAKLPASGSRTVLPAFSVSAIECGAR